MRKIKFIDDQYYHIYNRGTDKRKVFLDERDYFRFLLSLDLLNDDKDGLMILWRDYKKSKPKTTVSEFLKSEIRKREHLVEVVAYCLNPNHYHLIVKQIKKRGIERFIQKLSISYTRYFNEKNDRSGVLFQGKTKSTHIANNSMLLYLSAYVNCNCEIHGIAKAEKYRWSSFPAYLGKRKAKICCPEIVLSQFRSKNDYCEFAKENAKGMRIRKENEKILFE